MKQKYKRLTLITISILIASFGLWLILDNFNQNITFFYTPAQLDQKNITNKIIRVGGLVKSNSIAKLNNGLTTEFIITDAREDLIIRYTGILPNLFRENQGIVAKGKLVNNIFIAEELLAKHDENYMPKEITNGINYIKTSKVQ
ncbi:MAG: cytochrome c maturation protein CcmE [Rickettsiales bacterium]